MKKHTMIAAVIAAVFVSAGGYSQTILQNHVCTTDMAKSNYIMALRSENEGLEESSLMQSAKVRILYPDVNFQEVKQVVDSLAVNGNTPTLRYEAYLASNVLENPSWFAKWDRQAMQDPDTFFVSVAAQLQERIFGSRTN